MEERPGVLAVWLTARPLTGTHPDGAIAAFAAALSRDCIALQLAAPISGRRTVDGYGEREVRQLETSARADDEDQAFQHAAKSRCCPTGTPASRRAGSRRAEDLLHRLASGKLVNELVEVADLLHERVPDLLYADAADHAGDELPRRIQRRSLGEEPLEVRALLQLRAELARAIAGQPAQDLVNLLLRPTFFSTLLT